MKRTNGVGAIVGVAAVLAASLSAPAVGAQPQDAGDASQAVASASGGSLAPAAKARKVSVLYATTAQQGSLTAVKGKKSTYVMTLRGASDHVTWFADRPARQSGFLPTAGFVSSWAGYGFAEDPPNVALVMRDRSGATDTVVAVMTRPKVTAKGVLTAQLRVLTVDQAQQVAGNLAVHAGRHDVKVPSRFTSAALFIDDASVPVVNGCAIQPNATCANANLSGEDLTGANLTNADLSGAYLTGADLSGADLTGADLSGADLSGADLSGADLSGADLKGATLEGADLTNANLPSARLVGANLTGADLTGANLTGANLSGAYLTGADLSGADLSSAALAGANLSSARLVGANLSSARLVGANLTGADLTGANLTGANLNRANLNDVTWTGATCPSGSAGTYPCTPTP